MEPATRNTNEQAQRDFLTAGAAVLVSYCAALWRSWLYVNDSRQIVIALILLFMLNFILHALLCVQGKIAWYALPVWWAFCVVPLYIASFHILTPSYFGRDFTFISMGIFTLLPPLAVSLLTSLIYLWRAKRKKNAAK